MIINHGVQSVLTAYLDNKPVSALKDKQSSQAKDVPQKDEVVLSTQAQAFSQALQKAKNMSEVRHGKVDEIAAQIETGRYRIDAEAIAEKLLNYRY